MKKVLLLTLCVLIALPSLAMANGTSGKLDACGQAFVFGIFAAPTDGTVICWKDCCGPIGGDCITSGDTTDGAGAKCVSPSNCGKYCFHLICRCDVVRLGTTISGVGNYFNGLFQVCGKLAKGVDVKCGPGQNTSICFTELDMF
jgi:hypothetical protein